jgi:hypothetical protein
MNVVRTGALPRVIDAVAEEIEVASPVRSRAPVSGEIASFGARLTELLAQETPQDLLGRLADFKRSVDLALRRSSSVYQILQQLEESGLKDCARCTQELEGRLARNPHFVVLRKIEEAEKLVAEITAPRV